MKNSCPNDKWTQIKPNIIDIQNVDTNLNGRFDIVVENIVVPCWIGDITNKSKDRLYVVLMGNRPHTSRIPMMRWSWDDSFDGVLVCISDPTYTIYPRCHLGWYFGSKEHNGYDCVKTVISKFQQVFKINNKGLTFYESSGGGLASILMARMFPESSSIAINPQIDFFGLDNRKRIKNFIQTTGFSPEIDIDRLDCVSAIRDTPKSRFIIVQNCYPGEDYNHMKFLSKELGIHPSYGLNTFFNNLILWTYCTSNGEDPHKAIDKKAMLPILNNLCQIDFKDVPNHAEEYMRYTLLWNEIYDNSEKLRNDLISELISSEDHHLAIHGIHLCVNCHDSKTVKLALYKMHDNPELFDKSLFINLCDRYDVLHGRYDDVFVSMLLNNIDSDVHKKGIEIAKNYLNTTGLAEYRLASLPKESFGYNEDDVRKYLKNSLSLGYEDSRIPLIKNLMNSKNPTLQKEAYEICINVKNPGATISFNLYSMYNLGLGTEKNPNKSIYYLKRSASMHYWRAENKLINLLIIDGSSDSINEAINLCKDIKSNKRRNIEFATKILESLNLNEI